MTIALKGKPTNTRKTKQYDNIVFNKVSTSEFTGHSGVIDLMREYDLTAEEALEISDHLPIWADFSPFEDHFDDIVSSKERQLR